MVRRQPRPTLFPYTTLFRSKLARALGMGSIVIGGLTLTGEAISQALEAAREIEQAALHLQSAVPLPRLEKDRKSTRLNSSHVRISYAVFCLKKKKNANTTSAAQIYMIINFSTLHSSNLDAHPV